MGPWSHDYWGWNEVLTAGPLISVSLAHFSLGAGLFRLPVSAR